MNNNGRLIQLYISCRDSLIMCSYGEGGPIMELTLPCGDRVKIIPKTNYEIIILFCNLPVSVADVVLPT